MFVMVRACTHAPAAGIAEGQTWCLVGLLHCLTLPSKTCKNWLRTPSQASKKVASASAKLHVPEGRSLCSDGAGVGVVAGGTFPLARSPLLMAGVGGLYDH